MRSDAWHRRQPEMARLNSIRVVPLSFPVRVGSGSTGNAVDSFYNRYSHFFKGRRSIIKR